MSRFWEHCLAARDDIRHKLVEEAWYGRQTTGDVKPLEEAEPSLSQGETKASPAASDSDIASFYASTRGSEVETADLYGTAPAANQAPAIEPPEAPKDQGFAPEP